MKRSQEHYQKGTAFRITANTDGPASIGDIVFMHRDDGTSCPYMSYSEDSTESAFCEDFENMELVPTASGDAVENAIASLISQRDRIEAAIAALESL